MKNTITFDKKLTKYILDLLKFKVTTAGIIVDKDGYWVPSIGGKEFLDIEEFAGVVKTDEGIRLVSNDIFDLMEMADHLEEK